MSKPKNSKKSPNGRSGTNPGKKNRVSGSRRDARDSRPKKDLDRYNDSEQRDVANDPAWWMKTGQLAKDASSISTFNATGAKTASIEKGRKYYTPAGVLRIDYIPYFGDIDSPVDAINVASKVMYDLVNSKNSRNPSYDPSDLMLYTIAVANAWVVHSWVQRIVGMFNTFSSVNRYWWVPLAQTMGVAPISTQNDIITWRNLANRMAIKLNMLSVPDAIPYYSRAIQMCEGVYADSLTQKASLYYFSPAYLFAYGYDSTDKVGTLELMQCPWFNGSKPVTPDDVEAYFNELTWDLFNDSDVNTMSADIIRAYGIEHCFKLPQVTENYAVSYQYVPGINLQLHNARVFDHGAESIITNYKLTQDMNLNCITANGVISHLVSKACDVFRSMDNDAQYQLPLDFPTDAVSNEDVVEATRLLYYYDGDELMACTELLVRTRGFVFSATDSDPEAWVLTPMTELTNIGIANDPSPAQVKDLGNKLGMISKFHDAPLVWLVHANSDSGQYDTAVDMHCVSDLTNFTTISKAALRRLNDACTLSIFSPIPLDK